MTKYSFAQLPKWATKVSKIADAVVSQATNDMLASVKIVPGITRGGSRVQGTIPRDIGALAASLQSSLYGSSAITGSESYLLTAASMKGGDVARFVWGGAAAPYAKKVHDGANGVAGTFWVDVATSGWSRKWIPGAVAKARAELL